MVTSPSLLDQYLYQVHGPRHFRAQASTPDALRALLSAHLHAHYPGRHPGELAPLAGGRLVIQGELPEMRYVITLCRPPAPPNLQLHHA